MKNSLNKEIELKFLIQSKNDANLLLSNAKKSPHGTILSVKEILQAYMVIDEDDKSVWRIRLTSLNGTEKASWTYKRGTNDPSERDEEEAPIDVMQAKRLILSSNRVIRKTRTTFSHQENIFELDEFHDELSGLYLMEVEVPTVANIKEINLPTGVYKENDVTSADEYRNDYLAKVVEQKRKNAIDTISKKPKP